MAERILFVGNSVRAFIPYRRELLGHVIKLGHEVRVACPSFPPEQFPDIAPIHEPITLLPHSTCGVDLVGTYYSLAAVLKRFRPTVVVSCTIKAVIVGSFAAHFHRVPKIFSIITGLGYVFTGDGLRARMLRSAIQPIYRQALSYNHRVFFQNDDDRRLFIDKHLVAEESAVTVPGSGVDTERFMPGSHFPSRTTFLTITRLIRDKGVDDLIAAAKIVKERIPDARLVLLGEQSSHPTALTKGEIDLLRNTALFEMPEPMHDVRPCIDDCSVFVLPSHREGLPRSALEAMAMGRPLIVTDVPGCRDLVKGLGTGILTPPRDPSSLAGAMQSFIDNPAQVISMGSTARKVACEMFDVRQVNRLLIGQMGLEQ